MDEELGQTKIQGGETLTSNNVCNMAENIEITEEGKQFDAKMTSINQQELENVESM